MLIGITGTPGTGKTSVSNHLRKKGYVVFELNKIAEDQKFFCGIDEKRDTKLVDVEKLNNFLLTNYKGNKDIIFFEGHISHLLSAMDKIIILRCKPDILIKRLQQKNWSENKISENLEAETLDVILSESAQRFDEKHLFEINTTDKTTDEVTDEFEEIIKNDFKPMKKYNIGKLDWSDEIIQK